MNTVLVCGGMAVIPLFMYFALSMAGVTSMYKVIIPEIFIIIYIIVIAVIMVKKIEKDENIKKKK